MDETLQRPPEPPAALAAAWRELLDACDSPDPAAADRAAADLQAAARDAARRRRAEREGLRTTGHRGGDATAAYARPADASAATADLPPGGAAGDPLLTVDLGAATASLVRDADPSAATGTFDAAAAGSGGAAALRKRPLPKVPGYAIHGVLGRGGMGVVYRATQLGLNREVALKMVLAGEHADPAQLARFGAEARAVAHVRHPNIVQIFEIGELDGLPYFSLELCPGGSLDRALKHEPQPPKAAAATAAKLADAMAAAHAAGVIHRDLKPANILLDAAGEPKVTDFGLARELDADSGSTRTGSILGTPSYMAPEQALGQTKRVGPASDQYSLGATLYDLLTGRPPFQGTSVMETLEQVRSREPVPPRQLQPGCPRDLETVCLKAMAKEPEKRYADCAAFAADLRAFIDGRPIAARPAGAAEKAWRWARRNPRVAVPSAAAILSLALAAVLGVTFAVVFDRQKQTALGLAEDRRVALVAETQAKAEADASNALTRDSLQRVAIDAPGLLRRSAYSGAARRSVVELFGEMLRGQLDDANSARLPDRARLQYRFALAGLLAEQEGVAAAKPEYEAALALAEKLAEDPADPARARGTVAIVHSRLAGVALAQRDGAAFRRHVDRAEAIQRALVADPAATDRPLSERQLSLADTLGQDAQALRGAQEYPRALERRVEQIALLQAVVAAPPTPPTARAPQMLAEALREQGVVLTKLGRDAEAEGPLKDSAARLKDLAAAAAKARKPDDQLTLASARSAQELGDYYLVRGKLAEAAQPHLDNLAATRGVAYTAETTAVRQQLAQSYYRAGTLALKKNGRPASLSFYRKGLDLAREVADLNPPNTGGYLRAQLQLATFQARVGDHKAAAALIAGLIAGAKGLPQFDARIDGACVYALCADALLQGRPAAALSADERKLEQQYRDFAVAELTLLLGPPLKFADPARLKTDPDLDPLRTDPRFAALVATAEANAKALTAR